MNQHASRTLQAATCAALALFVTSCGGGGGGGSSPVQPPNETPVSSADSRVTANPIDNVLADGATTTTITVEVVDTLGAAYEGAQVTLEVSGTGNTMSATSATTDASGRVQSTLTSTVAEAKTVTAVVTFAEQTLTLEQQATVTFVDPSVPQLLGSARYEDGNRDGRPGPGDRLVVGFTLDVDASGATPGDFSLPVSGDSFGTGAAVQNGPASNEVSIELGAGAVLRTRGTYGAGATGTNSPSGLQLAAQSGIVSTTSSSPATPGTVDVAPAFGPQPLTFAITGANAVAVGDVDRDGLEDLWVARDAGDQLLLGDGSLGFATGSQFGGSVTNDVLVRQLNRFAGEDVVTAHPNGIQVWNNGSAGGTFSLNVASTLSSTDVRIVRAVDMDGDGYPDLVSGGAPGVEVWQNQRNLGLTFSRATAFGPASPTAIEIADFDGNGRPDVVLAAAGNPPRIHEQTGPLTFTASAPLPFTQDATDLAVGDVDGDGDPDILAAAASGNVVLFRNLGGSFSTEDTGFAGTRVLLTDRDGDGRLDATVVTGSELRTWLGDGTGAFTETGERLLVTDTIRDARIADLDRDGDGEFVTVDSNGAAVRNGSLGGTWGTATYAETDALGTEDTLCAAYGDFDGDDDVDMVTGNSGPDFVLFNDGSGTFTYSGQAGQTLNTAVTASIAVGDMDGDGDLDIVTGGPATVNNEVWLNDGAGNFTSAFTFGNTFDSLALALGDIDGDFDLDVVVGNDGQNRVWRNDSSGGTITLTLRDNQLPANPTNNDQRTNALVLVDMDRDGDLDLLVANGKLTSGEQNQYFSNDGSGTFTFLRNLPGAAQPSYSLAVADLNGNGNLDVAVGNRGNGTNLGIDVIEGFGNGQFSGQTEKLIDGVHDTRGLAAADVDGDGDVDLLAADLGATSFRTWLNDGTGTFAIGDRVGNHNSAGIAVADFDRDGDIDALVPCRLGQPNIVYSNR